MYGSLATKNTVSRGLSDRSSTPHRQPTATPVTIITQIDDIRRTHTQSATCITVELESDGVTITRRTVTTILKALGLERRRFIDPTGENNRKPQVIIAECSGHMVHIDVKKSARYLMVADGEYTGEGR